MLLYCPSFILCLYGVLLWVLLLCLDCSAFATVLFGLRNMITSQLLAIALDGYHLNYWYSIVPLFLMNRHYIHDNCVQLDPPFLLVLIMVSYDTRQSSHFCNIFRYLTAFGQNIFRSKATMWWNGLPCSLFNCDFSQTWLNHLHCV